MKFEVIKKTENSYTLIIDNEKILENVMLSDCFNKIEQWLKLKYLKETKKGFLQNIGLGE